MQILRILYGILGLVLVIVAVGIFFSNGPTASTGRLLLYGIPVLGVGLCGVWLTRAQFPRLLFVLINGLAAAIALFGVELFLQTAQTSSKKIGEFTPSLKTMVAELRNSGVRAFPHVCPSALTDTSLLGTDGKPLLPLAGLSDNLLVMLDGTKLVTRSSDKYGFNNPKDQWRGGQTRVMAVGDSFTFGADIQFGYSFIDLIRKEVGLLVNLGCGGNGPLSELAALSEYGPVLRPKTLVWSYFEGNDLTKDLQRELKSPILKRYLKAGFSQQLADRQSEIDASLKSFLDTVIEKNKLSTKLKTSRNPAVLREILLLTRLRGIMGLTCGFDRRRFQLACDFDDETINQFSRILELAVARAAEWDARLIFVYLPAAKRYSSWTANIDADGSRIAVLRVVDELGIDRIDMHEVFHQHTDPQTLFDGHYSKEGHAIVAEKILERLRYD